MSSTTVDVSSSLRSRRPLGPLYWGGVALAALTGAIHLWLGIDWGKPPLVLAGLGFAVGIAAVVLDVRRQEFAEYGIPFTAVQIPLYAIGHYPADYTPVGLADKVVQAALVVVLVVLVRRE